MRRVLVPVFMVFCLLRWKAGKTKPLYCLSEESALAVSGELYGKKKTDPVEESLEDTSEEKEEL